MEVLMHEASKGPDENENSTCCSAYHDQRPNDEKVEIITEKQNLQLPLSKKEDCMDITFENITYSVSLGFRKGISILYLVFFIARSQLSQQNQIKRIFSIKIKFVF